jgi:predicted Zn-dependent protease
MIRTLNKIILASVTACASLIAQGQEFNVLQKAMIDELDRNMKELRLEGHDAPFFINYTLTDQTSTKIFASLGALIASSESPQREKTSIRVLVGDYDFNDESLDNNLFSGSQANEISMPLDDDYLGIRRSFWISTDNVYRNAAKQFKKNKETLKEQSKQLSELPHRRFAKTPISKVDVVGAQTTFNRGEVEDYLRELSAIFNDYPEIRNSGVAFGYDRGHRYQVNSEGSINRTPIGLALLSVSAQLKTAEGDIPFSEIKRIYSTPAAMPPLAEMKKEVKLMIENLIQSAKAKAFDEEYSGPVLYEGVAVADVIIASLFGGAESLDASDNIPSLKGFRYDENLGIDGKIGKPLFAKGMTVKAMPKMRRYNGEELLGAFEVDDEGVVPADELILVENGVLKNLLNDRTLVKEGQQANGLGSGPGVVSITFPTGIKASELKSKLINLAKQQGLEYALIVRETFGSFGMANVYKVSLETGAEELMRAATLSGLSLKNFKRISEVSAEMQVQNLSFGGAGVMSAIVPKGLLLEEVEVGVSRVPRLTEDEYVASPLHK